MDKKSNAATKPVAAAVPVALQLYSVRKDCEQDLPGTLKAVAKMGYAGVEFAGYYGRSAAELRTMLDDLGLAVAGTHTALKTLLGDQLAETVAFNHTLGNRFLIVPSLPEERRSSRQAWLETAELFNEIAEKLAHEGMVTGYHNHHVEFQPLDGELPWDTFFANTRQDVVMQIDLGNALRGGADPVPFIERYPGRAVTVHLKSYSQEAGKVDPSLGYRPLIGDDDIPWEQVFSVCETIGGTEWHIVEYESDAYPPLEAVDRFLKILRSMGK
jgi:sugar phosphate isomerase/epimerase